jgi:hypothetical protein
VVGKMMAKPAKDEKREYCVFSVLLCVFSLRLLYRKFSDCFEYCFALQQLPKPRARRNKHSLVAFKSLSINNTIIEDCDKNFHIKIAERDFDMKVLKLIL